ncbi:MAG: hypothetical protein IJ205_00385 [Bacteroidales bacterium]|nr:hypothetical protein [Bacteroidales bacterium]
MKIKYIVAAFVAVLLGAAGLNAQTPEEIVKKMSVQLDRAEAEGLIMDLNIKMPIVGTVKSHNMVLGKKMKTVATGKDKKAIMWMNETTKWEYDQQTNEIVITSNEPSKDKDKGNSEMKAFDSLTDGYDLVLEKETADAWYILCKKSKSNKDKDDPNKMNLAVSKATNLPIYLRMKQSVVTVSIENVGIGVSEKSVTFNPAEYPNAKIIDKR